MAETTRLELATSGVTGRRSNRLNYVSATGIGHQMPWIGAYHTIDGIQISNFRLVAWIDVHRHGDEIDSRLFWPLSRIPPSATGDFRVSGGRCLDLAGRL
jgi:hypothetical protein